MNQLDYEIAISEAQKIVLNNIELFEEAFDRIKDVLVQNKNVKSTRTLLNTALLIAHIEEGKKLFLKILKFSSSIDTALANEYWNEFDDLENLAKKRFFNITIQPAVL